MKVYVIPDFGQYSGRVGLQYQDCTHVAYVERDTDAWKALIPVMWGTLTDKHRKKYTALMSGILTGDVALVEVEQ